MALLNAPSALDPLWVFGACTPLLTVALSTVGTKCELKRVPWRFQLTGELYPTIEQIANGGPCAIRRGIADLVGPTQKGGLV